MTAPLAAEVTKSFAVFVFMVETLVRVLELRLIPPAIVPPANGRNGPPDIEEAGIPESPITFAETKLGKFPATPVDVLLTTSFTALELTVPTNEEFE